MAERDAGMFQAQPVGHAAHALIDHLEGAEQCTRWSCHRDLPGDPTPVSTGLESLDMFLGGGLRRAMLTIVESDDSFLLEAIGFTLARSLSVPVLFDHRSLYEATCWIVAGEADVSAAGLLTETGVTADDLIDMRFATQRLDELSLTLTSASNGEHLVECLLPRAHRTEVVIVAGADRYPQLGQLLDRLRVVARRDDLAVLVTTSLAVERLAAGQDIESIVASVGRTCDTAVLLRPDDDELLSICELEIDPPTGRIMPRSRNAAR